MHKAVLPKLRKARPAPGKDESVAKCSLRDSLLTWFDRVQSEHIFRRKSYSLEDLTWRFQGLDVWLTAGNSILESSKGYLPFQ
ncbi:hypothetical protein SAMN05192539_1004181 [Paraburkholderia diazotrophica]|uniref:Uncharacterized protein n=1 Tax=Paraburkholderia diazotrophica TaxID=667676 RepID=A0A1H6TUU5_9BURK|nr:hypothetical protein SAMN05192539_1004181 [Paraburkholderia diazotrophica]